MYKDVIKKLKEAGVLFTEGLSDENIEKIEDKYQIHFPKELKAFYKEGLPISEGFYNWADFSEENVAFLEERISRPKLELEENISEIEWHEAWGEEPTEQTKRVEVMLNRLKQAAILIPLYKHRYLGTQYEEKNPIFSIYGTDIIYYGENLEQFFMIEFKYANYSDIDFFQIQKVEFWSDVM